MPGPSDFSSHRRLHHLYTTLRKDNSRDDRFGEWIPDRSTIAYFAVLVLLGYCIFKYLDLIISTLLQTSWNLIVFLTPSRIILALDKEFASRPDSELDAPPSWTRRTRHAAKSAAMQRILGLDANSLLTSLPRGRSLSGIGQAFLGLKEPCPPGLGNWDNSCYQNSIIQGFASLRALDKFLEGNLRELGDRDPFCTHTALKDIIDKLNNPSYGGRKLWTPPELKSMSSWQQQDAQEYFSKVIDQVDKEIRRASKGLTSDAGLRFVDTERNSHKVGPFPAYERRQVNDELKAPGYGEYTCTFRNPLEGLLAQRVGCMRCGWTEGLSIIPFNCLTVSLGPNWEYDIRDCLDEYTHLEAIDGVECAKCTLLRTQRQLEQLLKQIDSDAELDEGASIPRLADALRSSAETRLKVVQEALENEDFSEKTLSEKCHIPARNRVSSTKSRQAVIARAPKSLVIHVNRSVFNETTGMLRKNYADVRFPKILDLGEWCLGSKSAGEHGEVIESWCMKPSESMLSRPGTNPDIPHRGYELRAVITHYGRHENGHYICYRKYSVESFPATVPQAVVDADGEKEATERWFRLSDADVSVVSESNVLSQGGVFMLFYECIDEHREIATESMDEKRPGQEDIPLQEISFNSQGADSGFGGTLRSRNVVADKLDKMENRPDSSGTSTGSVAGHYSPNSDVSDTSTASSFSCENGSPGTDKIQPAPAMKTAVTPFENTQETCSNVNPGPSMVKA
ncbi:hypothetical protein RJZ56_004758 [Blastomyces dermatitidis]|uniref:ubiquitinyl hydrolase 1 n=2 Tax=Blastomyces TaxID=229219 RepID=A0A179V134_BLAGS|nr:ubiquitin thiolesterase [Blastomyces gilchristii SLH14081]XP_045276767.1 ubiquitin thiolesterase [Blastomyces dermatitidis ER-3]EEQ89939.1 ubiquitin thiolesterase [Blastomyces dermatitidis ER-3]EQL37789.1 ubiquitin thiolesterase [Blastomyces dermatitidis ATCC 26199]OAT13041.1 ubiquitin thiolesterase [Blastomyces gilchristii SLH14081]